MSYNSLIKDKYETQGEISIYTDGSKIPFSISVGSDCYCPRLNIRKTRSISSLVSIFTAECIAINDAMQIAIDNKIYNFNIFTDSLSALQSLNIPCISIKTNPYIFEIKQKIKTFYLENPNNHINFVWVPSHVGIKGNEEADRLAKQCTNFPSSDLPIPYTDILSTFKEHATNCTIKFISDESLFKGKKYFQNFYKETPFSWFHNIKLCRNVIVTINRCRSDHYNLNASLVKINVVNSASCQCGWDFQDLDNILWQCPLYDDNISDLLEKLNKIKIFPPLNINMFLFKLIYLL